MNSASAPDAPSPQLGPTDVARPTGTGMATASLVLGILGLISSPFLIGLLLALPGLWLGRRHLSKRAGSRRLAWTGVWLSGIGLTASLAFGVLYAVVLPRIMQPMPMGGPHGPPLNEVGMETKPSPDFALTLLDGTTLGRDELLGRRVALVFWATWCGPCLEEVPHLKRLRGEFAQQDLAIVAVSAEDRTVLKKFVADHNVPYLVVSSANSRLEGPLAQVNAYPTLVMIDRDGRVESVHVGGQDYAALREIIARGLTPSGGAVQEVR